MFFKINLIILYNTLFIRHKMNYVIILNINHLCLEKKLFMDLIIKVNKISQKSFLIIIK